VIENSAFDSFFSFILQRAMALGIEHENDHDGKHAQFKTSMTGPETR